jgi:hypothetical protein
MAARTADDASAIAPSPIKLKRQPPIAAAERKRVVFLCTSKAMRPRSAFFYLEMTIRTQGRAGGLPVGLVRVCSKENPWPSKPKK